MPDAAGLISGDDLHRGRRPELPTRGVISGVPVLMGISARNVGVKESFAGDYFRRSPRAMRLMRAAMLK